MGIKLVVVEAFTHSLVEAVEKAEGEIEQIVKETVSYVKGDIIEAEDKIVAILESHPHHVVKIAGETA